MLLWRIPSTIGTDSMPNEHVVEYIRAAMEWASLGIEILGVLVIVAGVLRIMVTSGAVRFLFKLDERGAYREYKRQMGRSLMLGLDFLVAGDIVKTVALEPTLVNLSVLALLVVVRTFLSWSLVLEIDGHWPWQLREVEAPLDPAGRSADASDTH
jgi:uncharacterized membrane protein